MHKSLIAMLRVIPLRFIYWFAAVFVLPPCLVFNRKPVNEIKHYFRERHHLSGIRLQLAVWKNHYRMAQVVIDRFASYGGKQFNFEIEGNEAFRELESRPQGFLLLSSHVGNSEMVGYKIGSSIKHMSVLAYAGEAASVMENRRRMLGQHNIDLIPVDESLNHIYAMNDALAAGNIVGMAADRTIGSQKTYTANFLGKDARFPLGAFATAVQRDVDVVAMFMMKQSAHRYRLIVKPIKLTDEERSTLYRRERMEALGRHFATELEQIVQEYPEQWFNYYDFWNERTDD